MALHILVAGRELDALVAERVMGSPLHYRGVDLLDLPPYSTSIAAAWLVVEKLRLSVWPTSESQWYAQQNADIGGYRANTAPLAICLAALKAVGVEEAKGV